MGISYKNFWSLNPDEAVVTGILRNFFKKEVGVFMPLDAQFKNIDLILINLKNRKSATLQVKGSRAYEPKKSETKRFGYGSAGWFYLKEETIMKCGADYFIFLVYVLRDDPEKGRRHTEPHIIIIGTKELQKIVSNKNLLGGRYSFFIWINPKEKQAFDFREEKSNVINLSDYLNENGLVRLKERLIYNQLN